MLSQRQCCQKSTFLLFDSSLPRRYYNILSALDCLPLLGCNHQLSQKRSHFKTCTRYRGPHAICMRMSTQAFTCCSPNTFTRVTGKGVQRQRRTLSPTCPCTQVPRLAEVGPLSGPRVPCGYPHAKQSGIFNDPNESCSNVMLNVQPLHPWDAPGN